MRYASALAIVFTVTVCAMIPEQMAAVNELLNMADRFHDHAVFGEALSFRINQ